MVWMWDPYKFSLAIFFVIAIWSQQSYGYNNESPIQFLARRTIPQEDIRPYNGPPSDYNENISYAEEKWEMLHQYTSIMKARITEPHSATDRRDILDKTQKKLAEFIDLHIKDLKRLQFELDKNILTMTIYKMKKKMETAEKKINTSMAMIPFGVYASPEFKCLGTSYYLVSAHNQEDVQMILSSERKPHCYAFRGAFAWGGFYHRHSESMYIGPHGDQFDTNRDMSQGLYCPEPQSIKGANNSDITLLDEYQCAFKISPREEFPESVQYEPKISYYCGPYRYFIPPTTSIRCIFSIFSMNFILRFGYDGVNYKSQDLSFMYQNGQVFYSDEPWAGMSCWNWACKWRHNQNQRGNEMFKN